MEPEKINIAIAGFGNIGSYFYKILEKNIINISIKTGKIPFIKYISAKNFNIVADFAHRAIEGVDLGARSGKENA